MKALSMHIQTQYKGNCSHSCHFVKKIQQASSCIYSMCRHCIANCSIKRCGRSGSAQKGTKRKSNIQENRKTVYRKIV